MQSYILNYHMLRKREPLIALGSFLPEGSFISASAVPHSGVKITFVTKLKIAVFKICR